MSTVINKSENPLFKVYPFTLSLAIFEADEEKALSVYIPGIEEALDILTDLQKKVILMRYKDMKTLGEISNEIGWKSKERARQVINDGIVKLRQNSDGYMAVSQLKYQSDIGSLKTEVDDLTLKIKGFTARLNSLELEKGQKSYLLDIFDPSEFDYKDITIDKLELSSRSYNGLNNARIRTLEDLSMMTKFELRRIRNLGESSVKEIINKLEKYGIKLEEGDEEK